MSGPAQLEYSSTSLIFGQSSTTFGISRMLVAEHLSRVARASQLLLEQGSAGIAEVRWSRKKHRLPIKAGSDNLSTGQLVPFPIRAVTATVHPAAGADRTFRAPPRKLLEPLSVPALLQLPVKSRS